MPETTAVLALRMDVKRWRSVGIIELLRTLGSLYHGVCINSARFGR